GAVCARASLSVCFTSPHPPSTATYTLSLHDALPISPGSAAKRLRRARRCSRGRAQGRRARASRTARRRSRSSAHPPKQSCFLNQDRKSTRLNSSHQIISYAVFCLQKEPQRLSSSNLG